MISLDFQSAQRRTYYYGVEHHQFDEVQVSSISPMDRRITAGTADTWLTSISSAQGRHRNPFIGVGSLALAPISAA